MDSLGRDPGGGGGGKVGTVGLELTRRGSSSTVENIRDGDVGN